MSPGRACQVECSEGSSGADVVAETSRRIGRIHNFESSSALQVAFMLSSVLRVLLAFVVIAVGVLPPATTSAQTSAPPSATTAQAAASTGFLAREVRDADGTTHKYTLFVPRGYTADKAWPTVVFLHGAGERGTDSRLPLLYGLAPYIRSVEEQFPFLAVFPQVEDSQGPIKTSWYSGGVAAARMLAVLDDVAKTHKVDENRLVLTGWSMGGYGVWELGAAMPDKWSALVPMAAGGPAGRLSTAAAALKDKPIWAFHGARDTAVPAAESRDMVAALRAAGGQPRYTEYKDADHEVWIQAFGDQRLFAWMLDPTTAPAGDAPVVPMPVSRGQAVVTIPEAVFTPVLDVPNALYARVGNDLIARFGAQLPSYVSPTALSGGLPNVNQSTSVQGIDFSISFSSISYNARLAGAELRAAGNNRLSVALGVADGRITIGGTSIVSSNGRKSAQAGPIGISIGQRGPVWLRFDLTPSVQGRYIRLAASGTSFSIPYDNYSVSSPAGVSTQGLFMDADKVSSSLVQGLYGQRGEIERQVQSIVPTIVAEMERQLNGYLGQGEKLAASAWPLPVYQPTLKTWPSDIAVDSEGVTLCLGITAGSINPAKRLQWVVVPPASRGAIDAPRTQGLSVGLAPQVIKPLSQLMIVSDVSRIHVQDTPTKTLPLFADRASMEEMFPDLKRYGPELEIQTEMVIADAIEAQADKENGGLVFNLSKIQLQSRIRPDRASEWRNFAVFDIAIRQQVEPRLVMPSFTRREFRLDWSMPANFDVKARFADGYTPEDQTIVVDTVNERVAMGWREFTAGNGESGGKPVSDVNVADGPLRMSSVTWASPFISVAFGPVGMRLTNSSESDVTYRTRAPGTPWSADWSLAPGKSHQFPVGSPMTIRIRSGETEFERTLLVGSHSEFLEFGGKLDVYQAREGVR
jgi:predicted esterase